MRSLTDQYHIYAAVAVRCCVMRKIDRRGLILLAVIGLVVAGAIFGLMRMSNLKNQVTGGTPFAQQPASQAP